MLSLRRSALGCALALLLGGPALAHDRSGHVHTDQSAVTITSTTTGTGVLVEPWSEIVAIVDVTAASGTNPTLDIAIQTSADNTTYATLASFTQITGTTTAIKTVAAPIGKYVRFRYTVAGTSPSFTFTLKAHFKN